MNGNGKNGNGSESKLIQFWGDKSQRSALADMIDQAVGDLRTHEERGKRKLGAFVTRHTLMARGHFLRPSQFQSDLLKWIRKEGFVPRQVTLAMNFTMLGGLICKGLVEETTERGVPGIRAVTMRAERRNPIIRAAAKTVTRPEPRPNPEEPKVP